MLLPALRGLLFIQKNLSNLRTLFESKPARLWAFDRRFIRVTLSCPNIMMAVTYDLERHLAAAERTRSTTGC